MIAPLASFLVVALVVVVPVVVFLRLVGRRRRRVAEPCCGACRYPVAGLTTPVCPECGSDLARVGIITRYMPRPAGRAVVLLLWTIAVAAIGPMISMLVYVEIPSLLTQREVIDAASRSGAYRSVVVGLDGWRDGDVARFESARLTLQGATGPGTELTLDLQSLIAASPWHGGGAGDARVSFGDDDILRWMEGCGVDVTSSAARHEASELAQRLRHLAAIGRVGRSASRSSSSGDAFASYRAVRGDAYAGPPIHVAFWIIAWIVGVVWLSRLATRRAAARTVSSPSRGGS